MSTWLWAGVLIAAVWAAHWGAERLADPLKKLRRQWGISAAAGGAFIGLAAAAPEIGINTTSAVRGVSDIGLGTMLGSEHHRDPAHGSRRVLGLAQGAARGRGRRRERAPIRRRDGREGER